MELSDETNKLLKEDEENGEKFREFLNEVNEVHKNYFKEHLDKPDSIKSYFCFVEKSGRPPSIRLRYIKSSNLDEDIKQKVIDKYKEIFKEYADYQIIEN